MRVYYYVKGVISRLDQLKLLGLTEKNRNSFGYCFDHLFKNATKAGSHLEFEDVGDV